ncbi:MAG: sigma-70 family RNA polymerase sigma factor [Prolixibacteraceae bacterium]|nr:sigma-70 family RNA polymerase sigma factor [Prolixibacteraceae bacterium]
MNRFENIYTKNYQLIFNVVQKMTCNADDASDIVQETFIALYQSFQKNVRIDYPRSWLYKVAVNKSINYLKQQSKADNIELVNNITTEENYFEINEQQKIVQYALNKLKPDEKILAVLYSEGMSYKEMAEMSGIKFTSIGKTLSRTLAKLGDELKKLNYEMY